MVKLKMSDDNVATMQTNYSDPNNNSQLQSSSTATASSIQHQQSRMNQFRKPLQHAAIVMLFTFLFAAFHLLIHLFFWRHEAHGGVTLHGWIVIVLVGFVLGALIVDVPADVLMLFCCVVVSVKKKL